MADDDDDTLHIHPDAQQEINKLAADDPKFAEAFREFSANLRQAMEALHSGRYDSFEDAFEAITGQRPKRVALDERTMDVPDGAGVIKRITPAKDDNERDD